MRTLKAKQTKKKKRACTTSYCAAKGSALICEACANNNKRITNTTSINLSWLVLIFDIGGKYIFKKGQ